MMRLAAGLFMAVVGLTAVPDRATYARPTGRVSVSTTVSGLQLTISTGRRTYPRDALVRVTVQAKNVSCYTITLDGAGVLPHGGNPFVNEVDAGGHAVPMPPQFLGYAIVPPSFPVDVRLRPGGVITRHIDAILWTQYLQAGATVTSWGVGGRPQGLVYSASLALQLTPAMPPHIELHTVGGNIYAVVDRPPGYTAPLLYRSSVLCGTNGTVSRINEEPAMARVEDKWGQTGKTLFVPPPCPAGSPITTLRAWQLIVGWRNRSMAALSYGTSIFTGGGLSFRYPASWDVYGESRPLTMFSSLIAYLSTTALGDPCPGLGFTYTCLHPVLSLPRQGVLVAWTQNGFVGWTISAIGGKRLLIDGREARLWIRRGSTTSCPINTSVQITAVIASPVPDNWFEMEACLRGPGINKEREQVLELLRSVEFTSPPSRR